MYADTTRDVDFRKSTLGYLMTFPKGAISWQSKLPKRLVLSTTKAKYIAVGKVCKEMLWLTQLL